MTNLRKFYRSRVVASIGGAAALLAVAAAPLSAQEGFTVQLEAKDGSMSITGQLIGFEDDTYVLETKYLGTVYLKAGPFVCSGLICPK